MTKEQYIAYYQVRNGDEILYQFYSEKFDSSKHKPFLPKADFIHLINFFMNIQDAFQIAFNYYNNKFNILIITDKDKTFLK